FPYTTLFRSVVLGVVHVAGHRDDARDQAALGGAGRHEHRQVAVAGEIAGAADAVHDPAPGDVGGVDVAVQVGLDHAVHGDAAEAADQLRVVGDLLRAQDDPLAVEVDVAVELLDPRRAERERGGRGHAQHAVADQVQHAVLDHLGERRQAVEAAFGQAGEHRVGDVAHARLQRQQAVGQAPAADLLAQEVDQVAGDLP